MVTIQCEYPVEEVRDMTWRRSDWQASELKMLQRRLLIDGRVLTFVAMLSSSIPEMSLGMGIYVSGRAFPESRM